MKKNNTTGRDIKTFLRETGIACLLALVLCSCMSLGGPHPAQASPPEMTETEQFDRYFSNYLSICMLLESGDAETAVKRLERFLATDDCPMRFYRRLAIHYLDSDENAKAANVVERGLEHYPDNSELLHIRAVLFVRRNMPEEALADLDHALEQTPGRRGLLELKAELYLKKLRTSRTDAEAREWVENLVGVYEQMLASAKGVERLPPLLVSASLYMHLDRPDRAAELATEATRIRPDQPRAWITLAGAEQAAGNLDGAFEALGRALALSPEDADLLEEIENALKLEGGTERGIAMYERLGADSKASETLRVRCVRELIRLGAFESAADQVTSLLKEEPDQKVSQLALGAASLMLEAGNEGRAETLLLDHQQAFPSDLIGAAMLSSLYMEREEYGRAYDLLDGTTAGSEDSTGRDVLLLKAQLLQLQGRNKDAQALLDEMLKKYGEIAQIQMAAGMLYQDMGQHEKAEGAYKTALELDPAEAEYYNTLGYFYAQTSQKLDEAERLVRRALEIKPDAAHIIDSLGWVFYRQGRYEEALEQLETAVRLLGEQPDAEVLVHLGDTYWELGRHDAAAESWERALEIDPKLTELNKKLQQVR